MHARCFILSLALLATAISPAQADDATPAITTLFARWEALRDADAPLPRFTDGAAFLRDYPDWPQQKTIRIRAEAAALADAPDKAHMQPFCATAPITGRGMFACHGAGVGDAATRTTWLHQGWAQGDFSADEEAAIRARYGAQFTTADHIARFDRLLYENKIAAARRMFPLVPAALHAPAEARIALMADARGAERLVKKLSPAQQREPGVLLARIGWRMRHHQEDQLGELLAQSPKNAPYPDLWWPARALAAREAITQKRPGVALAILERHGEVKPEALAEVLWLKGWIKLQFQHEAGDAYKDFYRLYTSVETPVSKARAAYWAGRAAVKNGNPDIATQWMGKAARHTTVFYGQLAAQFLDTNATLTLPERPRISATEKKAFDAETLVQVTRLLAQTGEPRLRDLFLSHLAATAGNPPRYALIAELAAELNGTAARVRVAKQGLRDGVVLAEDGWPLIRVPQNLPIEPALTLAIARQESEFDTAARSSADARGLMQLLPATARHVADQHLLAYGADTLDHPDENLTLGSLYLGQIIAGFDGSYILGIASYNAGPGSVRKWIAANGSPPKNAERAIDWVEAIPYAETRNYVMRVLENVQVYRQRLGSDAKLTLTHDLTR